MTLDWLLNISVWIALLAVGAVPVLMAVRVGVRSLRILSVLLALFAITHGLYHLMSAYEFEFWADAVFEPVSVVFLLAFGVYYSKKAVM